MTANRDCEGQAVNELKTDAGENINDGIACKRESKRRQPTWGKKVILTHRLKYSVVGTVRIFPQQVKAMCSLLIVFWS